MNKRLTTNTKIRHKNGKDYIVESIPYFDKFYCRTADSVKEFKVVNLNDIVFIHSPQLRLEF